MENEDVKYNMDWSNDPIDLDIIDYFDSDDLHAFEVLREVEKQEETQSKEIINLI